MPKLTEKQLFGTWLDIYYADQLNDQFLSDFEMEIKEIRKSRNRTKRMLKKAAEHYKRLYGKEPKMPK